MSQNAKKQRKFTCRLVTRTLNRKIFHWKTRWDTVSLVSLLLTTWGKSYRLWYFPGKLWQTACQSIAFPSRSQQCFQWNTTRVNVCVRSRHVYSVLDNFVSSASRVEENDVFILYSVLKNVHFRLRYLQVLHFLSDIWTGFRGNIDAAYPKTI